nr:receptor-like protein 12 [Ipomoea batatas]
MKTRVLQCRLFFFFFISSCLLLLLQMVAAQSQCLSHQKMLLLQFRSSLKFDSTASTKLARWNHTTHHDCCVWPGVECDISGHVISLILDNETITDGIRHSSALFSNGSLSIISVAVTQFSGSLPPTISNLSNLSRIKLNNCNFSGSIPSTMTQLTSLTFVFISLGSNYLSGKIPPSLFSLPSLKRLHLSNNLFDGLVDEYVNVSAVSQLESLDLSSNRLNGSFPKEIFLTHGLQELNLESNDDLSGSFPSFPENGSLRMISVAHTQFSGSLPASISNLSNLSRIDLSDCNFSGSIPSTMAQLTSLTYVDFSYNHFTGSIPHFLSSKNLTSIDFSFNGLTGPLSSKHFEGLSKIVYINLGSNYISGRISPSLFSLPSLQKLDLSNNQFDGLVAKYVNVSTSQLEILNLNLNCLNGSFPKYFFEFPKLVALLLSSNSLSGRVQSSLFSLPSLKLLNLSHNSFDGLSDEYVNVSTSQLYILDLSSNRLNGSFPKYFFEFPKLIELLLSSNSLSGRVQSTLFSLPSLQFLHLSNNSFDGLGDEYVNVSTSQLYSIDLSFNHLINWSFSKYFFEFPNLSELFLSSNSLGGRIEFGSLHKLPNLSTLDLSDNGIRGEIPSWIWEVGNGTLSLLNLSCNLLDGLEKPYRIPSTLIVLDLHSNQLKGPLPTLSNGFLLCLSNNSFTGTIPESICHARDLKILDLSNNKLGGTLPSCLLNNSWSLGVLNLGQNQIHGVYLWMLLHNKRCWEAYQQLDEVLIRLFGPRQRGRKSPGLGRRVRRN